MAYKKSISRAQRRHMDYLRIEGLRVGKIFQNRLLKLRRQEVKRVLEQCKAYGGSDHWEDVIDMHLDESYLYDWYKGLYVKAGMPKAKAVARDLSLGKAAPEEGYWESELINYANRRAGEEITLVQGTLRDELIKITRSAMSDNSQMPIEKLAKEIYKGYQAIELWQARRIAQTETMIGLADAGEIAARSLGVQYDKQWVISGLGNTRETHVAMDGVIVGMDEPFRLPDCEMMYPHDKSKGAPASEIINCACDVLHIPVRHMVENHVMSSSYDDKESEIGTYVSEVSANVDDETKTKIAENIYDLRKSLGITKGQPMSYDQANNGRENPNYNQSVGYQVNCQTCTVTHWMRRLGFDVQAKPNINGSAFKAVDWEKRFLYPDGSAVDYDYTYKWAARKGYSRMTEKRLIEYMTEKLKSDGVYEIYCQWKSGSAHVFMAEVKGGVTRFFDPQTGESNVLDYLSYMQTSRVGIIRVDDKILNPKVAQLVIKG